MNALAVLLALVPAAHFVLLYGVARRHGTLAQLRNNYAVLYLDWLFVPFNAIVPFVVTFSAVKVSALVTTVLLCTLLLHRGWQAKNSSRPEVNYFVTASGITSQGKIHFMYMLLQGVLVGLVFLSPSPTAIYGVLLALLAIYLIAYLACLRFLRKVAFRSKAEFPLLVLGLAIVAGLGIWWLLH